MILKYVFQNEKTGMFDIFERFIEFINFNEKTGKHISNQLISRLECFKIPLLDSRGQDYDNGANMSEKMKGVQPRLLEKNDLALYSLFAAHSILLVLILLKYVQ